MSDTTPVGTTTISQIALDLFKQADANGDNRLTRDEFQTFLTSVLEQLQTRTNAHAQGASHAAGAPAAGNPPLTPDPASTPNYVFAGLPSPADYAARGYDFNHPDPHHLKPIVSELLSSGQVAPTHDWVTPELVARLNSLCGLDPNSPDAFRAIDGETLAFSGDEFVHSAPVGHGLLPGQYDPNAEGEFFWGSTNG